MTALAGATAGHIGLHELRFGRTRVADVLGARAETFDTVSHMLLEQMRICRFLQCPSCSSGLRIAQQLMRSLAGSCTRGGAIKHWHAMGVVEHCHPRSVSKVDTHPLD